MYLYIQYIMRVCVCVLWLTFLCSILMSCTLLLRSTSVLSVYLYIPNVVYHPASPIMPLCSCCSFQHSSLDIRVLFLKHRKGVGFSFLSNRINFNLTRWEKYDKITHIWIGCKSGGLFFGWDPAWQYSSEYVAAGSYFLSFKTLPIKP